MNDINDQNNKTATTKPQASKKRNIALNILGITLFVIAALFYARDVKKNKEQAKAANDIRMLGSTPIIGLGVFLDPRGIASNQVYMVQDYVTVSNIMHELSFANSVDFPIDKTVEGDEFTVILIATNHTLTKLRAIRLYEDPDNLYVGVHHPSKLDADNNPVEWAYTRPALVFGLGKTFKRLADEHLPKMLENAPQVNVAITNLIEQARIKSEAEKAANETGEENTVSDIEAYMNATNKPAPAL